MNREPGTIQLVLYDAYHSVIQRFKKNSTTHPMVGWLLSRAIAHYNTAKLYHVQMCVPGITQPQGPSIEQVLSLFSMHYMLYENGDWAVQTDNQHRKVVDGIYVCFPRIEVYHCHTVEYTWNYFWEGKKVLPLRVERKLVHLDGPDGTALIKRGFVPKTGQDYQCVTLMRFTDNEQSHTRILDIEKDYIYIEKNLGADQGGGLCVGQ